MLRAIEIYPVFSDLLFLGGEGKGVGYLREESWWWLGDWW